MCKNEQSSNNNKKKDYSTILYLIFVKVGKCENVKSYFSDKIYNYMISFECVLK